ncbi:MAG: 2,3,4,5-tetrahydropyridine-2,6-dicarboxylate N-succinyltransferase [Deltaproteobacteria bacterium]|nr:2,3,4,5-tetrahydropyridine-2,6-dicarboxylate N-succinyltransferase [Deltaproteobacteria bacterium]
MNDLAQRLQGPIEAAFTDRTRLREPAIRDAVLEAIDALDQGLLRVATPEDGAWTVHPWLKQAILLYFALCPMERWDAGPLHFHDKIPVKKPPEGVRVVPPGTVRKGAYVSPGAIIMPGYVNIGAWVGPGTMVDTWATVGSCAQVGKDVHLSGGVGIGGVLEPPGARPVIIEDGVFVGSRAIVVEGVVVEEEAVLGAGVVLTASTVIVDVTGSEPVEHRGRVPARSVVVPGMRPKRFPAGEYLLPCALIIGRRTESTNRKTSLEQCLRDFGVSG